jgi:uncharacterized membrane protein YhiD involved in acid resistance
LALSLGLVGALSIVRFRTAIKDPEELAFLFITIAIGLGLGADQRIITFISVVAILSVIIVRSRFIDRDIDDKVMQLLITGKGIDLPSLEQITSIVEIHSTSVHLKRFDVNDNEIEVLYLGHFLSFDELKTLSDELRGLSGKLTISFLDSETG